MYKPLKNHLYLLTTIFHPFSKWVFIQVTGARIIHEKGGTLQITSSTSTSKMADLTRNDDWENAGKIGVKMSEDFANWTCVTRVMYWLAGFDSACLSSNPTGRICAYESADPSWSGLVFLIGKSTKFVKSKPQSPKSKRRILHLGRINWKSLPLGNLARGVRFP